MAKCPHCGAEVVEGDRFCGECGRQVQETEPPTMYAPSTLPVAPPGPEAVPPVSQGMPASASVPLEAAPKRKFPWLIVIIVLVGLCIVCSGGGAAVYFFWPSPTPTVTPTWTPTATPAATATATATATPTLTPTPMPTPTPAIQTEIYRDETGGYLVAYPVGWIVVAEEPGEATLIAESARVEDDPSAGPFVFCVTWSVEGGLEGLQQELIEMLEGQGLTLTQVDATQVGGVEGIRLTFEGQPDEASAAVKMHALLAMQGDLGHAFVLGSSAAEWEARQPMFGVIADSITLYDAVARPTPTPLPERVITSLVYASTIDGEGSPIGTTGVFPPRVTEVYAVFAYEGFEGVTAFDVSFYRDGQDDLSDTLEFSGEGSGQAWVRRYDTAGLASGTYRCELYVEGQLLATGEFEVLGGTIVLEDDFADAAGGWSTWDSDVSKAWYEAGQLHVLVKEPEWAIYSVYKPDLSDLGDLYVEVDVALSEIPEPGAEVGIVTRRNESTYYQFLVTGGGYYKIRMHDDDGWTTLADWTETDVLLQGVDSVNRLQAVCRGYELLFYVNGIYVAGVYDESFASGQIGLIAGSFADGGGVHAVFDNIVVYEIE